MRTLAALGRRAWHGEGRPWRTVLTLLLAELLLLPVPGALPVPRLDQIDEFCMRLETEPQAAGAGLRR